MSNIIPSNIQVPAHLAQRMGKPSVLAQALGNSSAAGSDNPRISIKGGRFRIVSGGEETVLDSTKIEVIIVGANPRLSKTFYEKAWTPDAEPSAPDCFSVDGIGPDPSSEAPQNDLCATCPKNAWGSKVMPNGQQVKACADQKRLAVVAADAADGDIYLLQVSPSALKGLNKYQKELSIRGIPPEIVRTQLSFDPDVSYPKLQFGFAGFIDEDTQNVVDNLFGSVQVLDITGEKVEGSTPAVAPAPVAPKPTLVSPAEEPAPAQAEPEVETPRGFGASKKVEKVEEVEEPKPAKTTKAAKAEPDETSSLADEIAALVGEIGLDDD